MSEWFSGGCGGPRVRQLPDGSYEIEGQGKPYEALMPTVERWAPRIVYWANKYNVPPSVAAAVVMNESGGYPNVTDNIGGVGLMGITHWSIKEGHTDEELKNPDLNLQIGCKLLGHFWAKYGGNPIKVLTSYNHGSVACGGRNPWNLVNANNYVGKGLARINGAVSGVFKNGGPSTAGAGVPAVVLAAAAGYYATAWYLNRYGLRLPGRT